MRLISRNDTRVDRTDRGADDPIRFDAPLVQRLIHTNLVGAQGSTALENEYHLSIRLRTKFIDWFLDHSFGHVTHRSLHKLVNCPERSAPRLTGALSTFSAPSNLHRQATQCP